MSKTAIGAIAVLVVVVLGFAFLGGDGGEGPQATAPAIEGAGDAANEVAEGAADAADTAVETATETATAATEAASDAANAASEAAADVANAAADTATDVAAEVAEGASDTAALATEAAGNAVDEAKLALGEWLTVDTFDFDKVTAAIEASDLGDVEKATLTTALDGAKDDPTLLEDVLAQIREALDV